ncbi:hypothetical protein Clacol_000864 [Clathrus columnatus]|uniref:DNA excision repair protein ERCC-1 n=1 Tax=Clathrus columnatus TaxID=1419009 RepID=A0AAV5A1P5_9AGAM|nr:hypothetical protein Clacol_000864 [Clathrus columnatus]
MNPVLDAIRNVPKEFGDIVPDFKVGRTTGVLYLRIEEAAHYLTTYKQFEFKPPNLIKERVDKDYGSILQAGFTSIRGINKTDVETLRTHLRSVANISKASEGELLNLPGFGPTKVRRLQEAFQKPFYPSHQNKKTTPFQFPTTTGTDTVTEADEMALVEEEEAQHHPSSTVQPFPIASSSKVRLEQQYLEMDNSGGNSMSGSGPPSLIQKKTTTTNEFRSTATSAPPPERLRLPRSPSPVWDIELDLNEDDDSPPPEIEEEEEEDSKLTATLSNDIASTTDPDRPLKKLKTTHTFGDPDIILLED